MPSSSNKTAATTDRIPELIRIVRGRRVILDHDLARLYSVQTRALNQSVRRNPDRFPEDFAFQVTPAELTGLQAQPLDEMPHPAGDEHTNLISSQIVINSGTRRGAPHLPMAFTEHGALMVANVLRSGRAVEMSLFVIRAFVKMREALAINAIALKHLAEIDRTLLIHDSALRDLYEKLEPLLTPPPEITKPKIGFHPGNR